MPIGDRISLDTGRRSTCTSTLVSVKRHEGDGSKFREPAIADARRRGYAGDILTLVQQADRQSRLLPAGDLRGRSDVELLWDVG
jgi:hypothetical protein